MIFPICGRYRLSRQKEILQEYFGSAPWDDDWSPRYNNDDWSPRYNIAPTQPVPVVRQHPKEPIRQLSLFH
ncbi:MAG: SOS response-associated peptidase [Acidobacteriia bacterium]|nr:SOS response-associated peptidase [Terriglobia bacterium]